MKLARCQFHPRCLFHGKMPIPRQDAYSTARCPFHGKMPIPRQDAYSTGATRGEFNS
ncbi:hypothetical protein [Moorena producens]|uniref:hypothetical protein n=1 Tax=Moorena producens TaxID=1155739 RepID=UPI003C7263C2